MRGRKPNLVAVDGGFRGGKCPPPPGSLNDHGQAEWNRVAPLLLRRGHLSDDVLATLEAYCRSVGLGRAYSATLDVEGHTVTTDRGLQSHPAFKMMTAMIREQRLLATELGLTPHRKGQKAGREGGGDRDFDADLLPGA